MKEADCYWSTHSEDITTVIGDPDSLSYHCRCHHLWHKNRTVQFTVKWAWTSS